jgi:hypothetical protein
MKKWNTLNTFIIGFLIFLAWQTRNFETAACVIGLLVVLFLDILRNCLQSTLASHLQVYKSKIVYLFAGLCSSWLSIALITKQTNLYFQYKDILPGSDFSLTRLWDRFLQVFFNSFWKTMTPEPPSPSVSLFDRVTSRNFNVWYEPLAHSQPLLLPLLLTSFILTGYFMFEFFASRKTQNNKAKEILVINISALVIIFGYLFQPIVGSSALKYGLMREFILPQFLILLSVILTIQNISIRKSSIILQKILPIFLVFSTSLSILTPNLKTGSYSDFHTIENANACSIQDGTCEIRISVKTDGQWKKLTSQPVEYRMKCGTVETRNWSTTFKVELIPCISKLSIYAFPLSFGISTTPESDQILTRFPENWINIRN